MKKKPVFLGLLVLILSSCGGTSSSSSFSPYPVPTAPDPIPSVSSSEEPLTFPELDFGACDPSIPFKAVALETYYQYGDASFFSYGEGEETFDILVDAGNRGYDGYEGTAPSLSRFLQENVKDGVLDLVVLSHQHADHYGGFENGTLQNSGIESVTYVVDTGVRGSNSTYERLWVEGVVDYWTERGATYYNVQTLLANEPYIEMGEGAYVTFLDTGYYPIPNTSGNEGNPNDDSIAMCVRAGDKAFYLAGDLANEEAEASVKELNSLEDGTPWFLEGAETVVYKASHHGSRTHGGNSLDFIRFIAPDYSYVSAAIEPKNQGTDPYSNQHPYLQATDRIVSGIFSSGDFETREEAENRLYFNGTAGDLTFLFDGVNPEVQISGAGRKACDYYDIHGNLVDPEVEKDLSFYQTAFYEKMVAFL